MMTSIRYERWQHVGATKEYEIAMLHLANGEYALVRRWGRINRQHSSNHKCFKTLSHMNSYVRKIRNDKLRPLQSLPSGEKGGYTLDKEETYAHVKSAVSHDQYISTVTDKTYIKNMLDELPMSMIVGSISPAPFLGAEPPPIASISPFSSVESEEIEYPSHYGTW